MNNIQQLIKKNVQEGRFKDIFPKTYTEAIIDRETGEFLNVTLEKVNFLFLPFVNSDAATRLLVPDKMRRRGLWISYIKYDGTLKSEYYNSDSLVDVDWQDSSNWLGGGFGDLQGVVDTIRNWVNSFIQDLITEATRLNPEDLNKNSSNQIQLADRGSTDGMGYVILRKNKTFAEQVTKENTIYEIRYDFDLNGATITIPEGCTLDFQGGSISDGTIIFNTTNIKAASDSCIFNNINFEGAMSISEFFIDWIGASIKNSDNSDYITKAIEISSKFLVAISFNIGEYNISKPIICENTHNVRINGNYATIKKNNSITTNINTPYNIIGGDIDINLSTIFCLLKCHYWNIKNLTLIGGDSKSNKSYGVVFAGCSNFILECIYMAYTVIGVYSFNLWMSNFRKIVCTDVNIGFKFENERLNEGKGQSGTSIHFDNCWINRGDTGYDLRWLSYSTLTCCGADHVLHGYLFYDSQITMNGCATEQVDNFFISVYSSNVTLNSCSFFSYKGSGTSFGFHDNSKILINNAAIQNVQDMKVNNNNSAVISFNSGLSNIIPNTNIYFTEGGYYHIEDDNKVSYFYYSESTGEIRSTVDKNIRNNGTSLQRPTTVNEGFEYYDSTLKKKILWNGTAWVNMDGTALAEGTALNNIKEIPASQDITY